MSSPASFYVKGVKQKLKNYWAAWLPSAQFQVGDIGIIKDYIFEKVGSLSELNIKFYEDEAQDFSPLDIASDTGVSLTFKAAGETNAAFAHVASGEAGLKIDFGSKGAFLINAPKTFEHSVADMLNLQQQIVRSYSLGVWEKDWVVITRLVRAPTATVLISQTDEASLELSAKAGFSETLGGLGNADAGITVKFQKGDTIKTVGGRNLNPVFQVGRLKSRLFSEPRFVVRSLSAEDPSIQGLSPDRVKNDDAVRKSLFFEPLMDDELEEK